MTTHHDKVQKYDFIKYTVSGIFLILFCAFISLYFFENSMKDVMLTINGRVYAAKTIQDTVGDFIENNDIPFDQNHDYITTSLNAPLDMESTNSFVIKNAVSVTLQYDGVEKEMMTYVDTIGDLLKENNIMLYENDRINMYTPETPIVSGMVIEVVRVTKDMEIIRSPIPYKVKVVENPTMGQNEINVLQTGEYGEHGLQFMITYENGVEVSRETILNEVIKPVVDEVIERGTIPVKTIQGTGQTFMYSKMVVMEATAYTLDPAECGGKEPGDPLYGITRSGLPAERGVIAVDPNVIPLFTKVYIETAEGKFIDYGMAIAADTGSAIIGNRIDLYMEEKSEALLWGRRDVRVYFVYEN